MPTDFINQLKIRKKKSKCHLLLVCTSTPYGVVIVAVLVVAVFVDETIVMVLVFFNDEPCFISLVLLLLLLLVSLILDPSGLNVTVFPLKTKQK